MSKAPSRKSSSVKAAGHLSGDSPILFLSALLRRLLLNLHAAVHLSSREELPWPIMDRQREGHGWVLLAASAAPYSDPCLPAVMQ